MIAEEAVRMRGLEARARKYADKYAMARQASTYVAEAYAEAAILLERRLAGINPVSTV